MIQGLKRIPFFRHIIQQINNKLFARYLPVYFEFYGQGKSQVEDEPAVNRISDPATTIHQHVPPGHYYSPIPNPEEISRDQEKIFCRDIRNLPGIQISDESMLDRLEQFGRFADEFPYSNKPVRKFRFSLNNGLYEWGEAIVLYSIMRQFQPKRIIEVGSGFSSALMLDVNEFFLDRKAEITFIDPYTERLEDLLRPADRRSAHVVRERLQDIDLDLFQTLEAGDIAFFDSTHVSKCNSDVNLIFFEVLPRLKPGVLIHFHDVFYPFEYPQKWVMGMGVAWNEDYLLRAFLQFNKHFEIFFFNDYLSQHFELKVDEAFKQPETWLGSSMWLRKVI